MGHIRRNITITGFYVLEVCNVVIAFAGFVAEQFLNNTATQLTYHGLCELTSAVQEGELCVFFRNNHFSTMTKYKVYSILLSLLLWFVFSFQTNLVFPILRIPVCCYM